MATTGWVLPAANTVEAGSGTWTSDTNIRTDDGAEATFSLAVKNTNGRWNAGQTFGLGALIPATATITKVEIRGDWRLNNAGGIGVLELQSFVSAGAVGAVRANSAEPTTLTTDIFDITADRAWTRADLLDGTFELKVRGRNGNSTTDPSYRVDHIAVQVEYVVIDNPPPRSLARQLAILAMAWTAANYQIVEYQKPGLTAEGLPAGPISGTSSSEFTTSGTLIGRGQISGTSSWEFSNSAIPSGAPSAVRIPPRRQPDMRGWWYPGFGITEYRKSGYTVEGAPSVVGDQPPPLQRKWLRILEEWQPHINVVILESATSNPAVPLIGSTTLVFTNSATITGRTIAAGTSTPGFTVIGTLRSRVMVTSTSVVEFTDIATLTGRTSITGTSSPAFIGAADLHKKVLVAGSSDASFTNSAVVLGRAGISGLSELEFTNFAVVTGETALIGTLSAEFSNSATLIGKGPLEGVSTPTFTGTAELVGRMAAVGTSSPEFTASGTLTEGSTLVPAKHMPDMRAWWYPGYAITEYRKTGYTAEGISPGEPPPPLQRKWLGTLKQWDPVFNVVLLKPPGGSGAEEVAPGPITGISAFEFSNAASLVGKGVLVGSSASSFTTSATLGARGILVGASNPAFTNIATLSGRYAISGISALEFTASLTPTGETALVGTSSPEFTTSGTLIGKGVLAGASQPAFSTAATLIGRVSAVGTSSPVFTNSAIIGARLAAVGTSNPAFTTTATLTARANMAGVSSFAFTNSGILIGIEAGAVSGTSSFAFTNSGTLGAKAYIAGTSNPAFTCSLTTTMAVPQRGLGGDDAPEWWEHTHIKPKKKPKRRISEAEQLERLLANVIAEHEGKPAPFRKIDEDDDDDDPDDLEAILALT